MKGHFTRGTRYSVLAALSTQGVHTAHSNVGAFDKYNFVFTMERFIALREPRSIIVVVNCNIHYSQALFEMIRAKGGIVVLLP